MAKYKIVLSDDIELVAEVNRQLQETKGYCPCALYRLPEYRCICESFRNALARGEETECHCGKYKIVKIED
jgi:hypothetical protein